MSRPLVLLGNVGAGSFVLFGRHAHDPTKGRGMPSPVFSSETYPLTLKTLRGLNPPEGALVYHAYLPTRQVRILRDLWKDVAMTSVTYADPGVSTPPRPTVPQEFVRLFDKRTGPPSWLGQGAWSLWMRAHQHADRWLGPVPPWTAYDAIDPDLDPLPPLPEPGVSYPTFMRRWKKGLLRDAGVTKA